MTARLFCPRCGVPLETTDAGALRCRPGDMELSELTRRHLLEWTRDEGGATKPFAFLVGGRWHCPVDGSRLQEGSGRLTCPRCDRSLSGRLVYTLVEFHPHAPTPAD